MPANSIGPATGLAVDLQRRLAQAKAPIRIGLVGSGEMGTDIVTQCDHMTGITVAAIAEINMDAAKRALQIAGRPAESFAVVETAAEFNAALGAGKTAVTEDAQ